MTQSFVVTGMSCANCVQKIRTALDKAGVSAHVQLEAPQITMNGDEIDVARMRDAVSDAGSYIVSDYVPVENEQVEASNATNSAAIERPRDFAQWLGVYYPLLLIVLLISLVSLRGAYTIHDWMLHFMAGFFIVFGFFKLLDIRGFRDAYASYDVLAKRWYVYGFIYPFLELALGFAFLFRFQLVATLWASVILMGFGGIGVLKAVMNKRAIRCACLGTVLKLPMTTVTIVENFGMVLMSLLMLAAL